MNTIQSLIRDICYEKKINFSLVSKDWVIILEKDHQRRYIVGYKFDLNGHAIGEICDDKFALYEVLSSIGIPVAEHYILFKNYHKEDVINYVSKYHNDIVVKSNTGTCGNDMYHTKDIVSLFEAMDNLLAKKPSISLSPFYAIKHEYRAIVIDNHVEVFYGKEKPIVIGNGVNSIYELLCAFNEHYFKRIKPDDQLNKILPKNEVYEYNWQFNLSKGARAFLVKNSDLKDKMLTLALKVSKELNLRFASIDMIELISGDILVLEVNSGVMMENFIYLFTDGKQLAKQVYTKAIEALFND